MSVMRLDQGQIEVMDLAMVPVLRAMTPAQRLASAHAMWRYSRARIEAAVRAQGPDWSEEQVKREICRRMLGSG
jgi:hypothetical protein